LLRVEQSVEFIGQSFVKFADPSAACKPYSSLAVRVYTIPFLAYHILQELLGLWFYELAGFDFGAFAPATALAFIL
jgi:hypothetical protein